jgi:hypothetical protein
MWKHHRVAGESRARVDLEPGGLRIVVPTRVRRTGITFATLFLVGWVAFWSKSIVDELASGQASDVVVSAILLAAAAAFLLPTVLWVFVGRDDILVTPTEVVLRRRIGPISRARRFPASDIDSIEAVAVDLPSRGELLGEHEAARPGLAGAIALEVGGKRHSFAEVGHAEAQDLVRRICEQLGRTSAAE